MVWALTIYVADMNGYSDTLAGIEMPTFVVIVIPEMCSYLNVQVLRP